MNIKIYKTLAIIFSFFISVNAQSNLEIVSFKFYSNTAKNVFVAGSFNNWYSEEYRLKNSEGSWQIGIPLKPGYYYYKFIVDGEWIPDPGNDWKVNDGGDNFNSIIKVGEPPAPQRKSSKRKLPKFKLPRPILTDNPEWVDLYYSAWQMCWNKIARGTKQNGFVKKYIDEGFNELIYQWDTNFMAAFAMYAPDAFPAMQSLDNFYLKQTEDGYIQRVYWEKDGLIAQPPNIDEPMINPPLFAWLEWRYYELTGDDSRLKDVLPKLILYYEWIERKMSVPELDSLYYNTPLGSGMDNTPREGVTKGGWIDMSSQQALAAKSIAEIASVVGELKTASDYFMKHKDLKEAINRYSWDSETTFYYDVSREGIPNNIKHIGSFWTLISSVADDVNVEGMINHLTNPEEFWRLHLVPTLSADDPDYDSSGHYWLGGVWAPTNYMVVKGLQNYGYNDIAYAIAENHVKNISDIYYNFNPDEDKIAFEERYADAYKTIWECYSPEFMTPATRWDDTFYSRQDFVGWSGLGPIAMLIENIIGVELNSSENKITWRINRTDKHGIRNLNFKKEKVDLICTPLSGKTQFEVKCNTPFHLTIVKDGKEIKRLIDSGYNVFTIQN